MLRARTDSTRRLTDWLASAPLSVPSWMKKYFCYRSKKIFRALRVYLAIVVLVVCCRCYCCCCCSCYFSCSCSLLTGNVKLAIAGALKQSNQGSAKQSKATTLVNTTSPRTFKCTNSKCFKSKWNSTTRGRSVCIEWPKGSSIWGH